jgi:lipoate-protein ligase A
MDPLTMKRWRFIYSGSKPPALNMAIDEALLEMHISSCVPIFRIYGWQPHGFSLGYSQNPASVLYVDRCEQNGIPFVKRVTGGGIIFHGDEVTYSIACSEEDIGPVNSVKDAYKLLCEFILETYRRFGLNPYFAIENPNREKVKSTFCFSSFEDYDILIGGKKIGGNAQRRKKKVIMQHGSIPITLDMPLISKYVKEPLALAKTNSTSLKEVLGREIPFEEFARVMKESFVSVFKAVLEEKDFSEEENLLIKTHLEIVNRRK